MMRKFSSSTWSIIFKVIIAVASALAGALGIQACQ